GGRSRSTGRRAFSSGIRSLSSPRQEREQGSAEPVWRRSVRRMERAETRTLDPALVPLVRARGEVEAGRHVERLLREAEPVIRGIIRRQMRRRPGTPNTETAEDVHGQVE